MTADVTGIYSPVSACRSCGCTDLFPVVDLGCTPLSDRLVDPGSVGLAEPTAPLEVIACSACSLVQLAGTVCPEELFCQAYPYYSSVSPRLVRHFEDAARRILSDRPLDAASLVVEIASNDGCMLRHFKAAGIPVLGIDPADGPAGVARHAGIETLGTFFTEALARQLLGERGGADIILANNVLAHVPDINDFVAGIACLLKPDGVAVVEVPHLAELLRGGEFDTIYHQHVFYFSVTALIPLLARHGLHIQSISRLDIHGGSLRLTIGHEPVGHGLGEHETVTLLREEEAALGLDRPAGFEAFRIRVQSFRIALTATLSGLKAEGRRIAGYGAAAKANTLLAYCGLGEETLDLIVDNNVHKQGLFMSGGRIPIVSRQALADDPPDFVLVLAWNFAKEIMAQEAEFAAGGGRFILPLPELRVV